MLRRRLTESPRHVRLLEERLAEAQAESRRSTEHNEKLACHAPRGARPDRHAQGGGRPAGAAAERLRRLPADLRRRHRRRLHRRSQAARGGLALGGRGRAAARPGGHAQRGAQRRRGARVRAGRRGRHAQGGARRRRPRPGHRPRRRGADRAPRRHAAVDAPLRAGDSLLLEPRSGYVYERIPKTEVEELVLEEVPDIDYADIGGLSAPDRADPRRGRAAVPARRPVPRAPAAPAQGRPALRPARLRQDADRQGGGQLAGQEGRRASRGKDAGQSYFLNIKGPELLNKYVGETERHIRLVFQRAREKASEGTPVIVFFDEMDSIFRTRGSGVSSDVENTIVPQLLSEIDGVEGLENVIVIGASNREDMIDPAILRPGPARREDQDRAAGRRGGPRHLLQVHPRRRCRCTPTTWPSTAATGRPRVGGDDPARRSSGCTPRPRRTASSRSPTPTATRRSCTSRTSTPAR